MAESNGIPNAASNVVIEITRALTSMMQTPEYQRMMSKAIEEGCKKILTGQLERNEPMPEKLRISKERYGSDILTKKMDYPMHHPGKEKGNYHTSTGGLDRKRVRELSTRSQYHEYSRKEEVPMKMGSTPLSNPRTEGIPPQNQNMVRYQNFELFKNLSQVVQSIGGEIINQTSTISQRKIGATQKYESQLIAKIRRTQLVERQKPLLEDNEVTLNMNLKEELDRLHRE
ncbi:hypothetical protein M5689_024608 [Euphorbia peplus]|nr:hypothetical protein M5689_024608 [Euphorbia peplus]